MASQEKIDTLFGRPCRFLKSCATWNDLPENAHAELAFIGRSNVGKSSLINALVNQKDLARTSNTPGRTQLLNYFSLDDRLFLVDLPGYGFAQAPKKIVKNWQKLIRLYLKGRAQLARVFVLIDARHGLKSVDEEFFRLLDEHAVSYQVILTKADKLTEAEQQDIYEQTMQQLKKFIAAHPTVLMTSALKQMGIKTLQEEIAAFAAY